MSSPKVIAYATDKGTILCPYCAGWSVDTKPVFEGEEFEYIPSCDNCHTAIEGITLLEPVTETEPAPEPPVKIRIRLPLNALRLLWQSTSQDPVRVCLHKTVFVEHLENGDENYIRFVATNTRSLVVIDVPLEAFMLDMVYGEQYRKLGRKLFGLYRITDKCLNKDSSRKPSFLELEKAEPGMIFPNYRLIMENPEKPYLPVGEYRIDWEGNPLFRLKGMPVNDPYNPILSKNSETGEENGTMSESDWFQIATFLNKFVLNTNLQPKYTDSRMEVSYRNHVLKYVPMVPLFMPGYVAKFDSKLKIRLEYYHSGGVFD